MENFPIPSPTPFKTQEEINAYNAKFYKSDLERWEKVGDSPLNKNEKAKVSLFLETCPQGQILELGSGAGRYLKALSSSHSNVLGIELIPLYVEKLIKSGYNAQIGRAEDLTLFTRHSIAGIFANALIVHYQKKFFREAVLPEWKRVLTPKGGLFVSYQVGKGEGYDLSSNDQLSERRFFAYYLPDEIQSVIEKSGFKIIDHFFLAPSMRNPKMKWNGIIGKKL